MSEIRAFRTEELKTRCGELRCGDKILLTGTVYTARDAAHKRFAALLDEGGELPIPLEGAVIYYAGPTPAPEGKPIGSCGPTTSGRMDRFAPRLLDLGLGCESVKRLYVEDFPLIVADDCYGGDIFSRGRQEYSRA